MKFEEVITDGSQALYKCFPYELPMADGSSGTSCISALPAHAYVARRIRALPSKFMRCTTYYLATQRRSVSSLFTMTFTMSGQKSGGPVMFNCSFFSFSSASLTKSCKQRPRLRFT